LCRYAGDEFVALLRVSPSEVRDLVGRIQNSVDNSNDITGSSSLVGLSIGWACLGTDGESVDELLLAADRAMYADKLRRKSTPSMTGVTGQAAFGHYRIM